MRITYILLFSLCFLFQQIDAEELRYEYSFRHLSQASEPTLVKVIREKGSSQTDGLIQEGVLFTYDNRHSKGVYIAGDFSNWRPVAMSRGNNGVWFYLLAEYNRSSEVRYKILDGGVWVPDPENPLVVDDTVGSFVSIARVASSSEGKDVTYCFVKDEKDKKHTYTEFRLYRPGATHIALVGDFNNWNPENDHLVKGSDGIWRTKLHIPEGVYRYKYIIDGTWTVDLYNPDTASDGMDGICSVLRVDESSIKKMLKN